MLTEKECNKILFNLGIKYGVSPKLIYERLLSDLDKKDLMEGKISIVELEATVDVWKECGMPDYAHGKNETYLEERNRKKLEKPFKKEDSDKIEYRRPFVDYTNPD